MNASEFGLVLVEELNKKFGAKLFGRYIDLKVEENDESGFISYTYFYENDIPENFFFKLECMEEKCRCSFWKNKSKLEICIGNNGCLVEEIKDKSLNRKVFFVYKDVFDMVYDRIIARWSYEKEMD